jgi:hypothetical protein
MRLRGLRSDAAALVVCLCGLLLARSLSAGHAGGRAIERSKQREYVSVSRYYMRWAIVFRDRFSRHWSAKLKQARAISTLLSTF